MIYKQTQKNQLVWEFIYIFLPNQNINVILRLQSSTMQGNPSLEDIKKNPQVIFANLKSEDQPTIIQSLCMNCHENGKTILLFTKIPLFREFIISSFYCEACGFRNNEVMFVGKLPDHGVSITFTANHINDLDRELIKSDNCVITFQDLQLEIPSNGKSEINTLQGFLRRSYDELREGQEERKATDLQRYQQLEGFLDKMKQYLAGDKFPMIIKVYDPSGNSSIKNPYAPKNDKNTQIVFFNRTKQQSSQMGYSIENAKEDKKYTAEQIKQQKETDKFIGKKIDFAEDFQQNSFKKRQVVAFKVNCESCGEQGDMRMCNVSVPYFTDMVIMSFSCQECGAHTAEIKNCGEIGDSATILTLSVQDETDLKRDLFKSETCAVEIPELELQLGHGTLGGVFTTVEGLLDKIASHFSENNPFIDSDKEFSDKIIALVEKLREMQAGKKLFTIILSDPLSHSFLANPFAPKKDLHLKIQTRPRTFDENETLGLNDMKVQNYGQSK